MKARMNQRKLFKHIYIDRSIIPESLVVQVLLFVRFPWYTGFLVFFFGLGIGNGGTEVFVENKSVSLTFAYCTLFFIKITKTINTNTVKLIKKLDLFEPFWWGPEVTVNRMKPVKHVFNEMFIIHLSFVSWSLTVLRSRWYKICVKKLH